MGLLKKNIVRDEGGGVITTFKKDVIRTGLVVTFDHERKELTLVPRLYREDGQVIKDLAHVQVGKNGISKNNAYVQSENAYDYYIAPALANPVGQEIVDLMADVQAEGGLLPEYMDV